jgi:hypothetical protein
LETKFRRIFVFWRSLWIQNGRHSKPKWSQYSAAYLTPYKYPFPLKSFHFWILSDFKKNYIGSHFENFKNKEHNFEWWSIFVSSFKRIRCLEWILHCLHLGYHGNVLHFEFVQPLKSCHTLRWIFLQSFMKEIPKKFKSPFFVSMATAAKFVQPIPIFFGLSRSTRCGCCSYQDSSISVWRVTCYDHFCLFHFFSIWPFPWQWQPFWKKSTTKGTTSHGIWYFYKVS